MQGLYRAYLGRSADLGGLQGFVLLLDQGGSVETVKAVILGSREYFARAGGTDAAFLTALYRDVLGRSVDPSGQKAFGGALAAGTAPPAVAAAVLGSPEGFQDVVAACANVSCARPPAPFGLASFVDALHHGASDAAILAAITGSPEYFGNV